MKKERLIFSCGREPSYPRNAFFLDSLQRSFNVVAITSNARWLPWRYLSLISRLVRAPRKIDAWVIGFFGQPLALVAGVLTRQPVLLDAYLSTYDTLCFDRKVFKPGSIPGRLAFWLDLTACRQADLVVLDTQAHADYFCETFGIPPEKLRVLFVGCDETLFFPRPIQVEENLVLYYGNYLPLQGIDVIIRAASLLKDSPIRFKIIGAGMTSPAIRQLAHELEVDNVEFSPPVPLNQLPEEIAHASLCLGGHFSDIDKAKRVIAGKTYQCLAMGKATIVGDNSANRELLTHGQDAWFCPMNDPFELSKAISRLIQDGDLRERLGENARQTFLARACWTVLRPRLDQIVSDLWK